MCVACRRLSGVVTSGELAAAVARLDRSRGGRSAPVRWQTRLAPHWLWFRRPPAKDDPVRVVVLVIDERSS